MTFCFVLIFALCLLPSPTNSIRCYKCEATNECKKINSGLSSRPDDDSSDQMEIVDCEHHCWKAISLGNAYRGCAKKRCVVSHTLGAFSSSVCCGTDYCNGSHRMSSSNILLVSIICSTVFYRYVY